MKLSYRFLTTLLLFTLLLCSCNLKESSDHGEGSLPQTTMYNRIDEDDSYLFITALSSIEFFNAFKYGWTQAGESLGVTTQYLGPTDMDINAMIQSMEEAISQNPSGIAIWGVDQRLIPTIDKAIDRGIPVVTVIGDLPQSRRISYIGSKQFELGYLGGITLAENMGGQGKAAILTLPGIPMFDEREQGYRAALANYPEIEIVALVDTQADSILAVRRTRTVLEDHPDIKGLAGTDSTGAMGAALAVEEAERMGDITIVGMDRNADVLEKIQSGVISASVVQGDVMMAFWAMQTLIVHNYYDPLLTTDNEAAGMNTDIDQLFIPANIVNRNNVEQFIEANQLYLNY